MAMNIFRQTRIYNFRDKCVVFACKRKFNSEILDMFSFLSVVGATSDCSWLGWLLMFAVGIAGISLHCSLLLTCWADYSAAACWISLICWKDFMWAQLAVTHLGLLSHWPVTNSIADNHQKGKFSSSDLFPKFLLKDVVGVWSKGDFMVTGSPACTSPRQLFRKKC